MTTHKVPVLHHRNQWVTRRSHGASAGVLLANTCRWLLEAATSLSPLVCAWKKAAVWGWGREGTEGMEVGGRAIRDCQHRAVHKQRSAKQTHVCVWGGGGGPHEHIQWDEFKLASPAPCPTGPARAVPSALAH
jgi:hypothetical protein